jgi:hypothetical protein
MLLTLNGAAPLMLQPLYAVFIYDLSPYPLVRWYFTF